MVGKLPIELRMRKKNKGGGEGAGERKCTNQNVMLKK